MTSTTAHQAFAAMVLVLATKPLAHNFAPHWLLRRNVNAPVEPERRETWMQRRTA